MAIEKVGIYRKYHGKIPTDKNGKLLPQEIWPKKRQFSWSVRWFGTDGKRYSKSFKARKEAEKYAETRQLNIRSGKPDLPQKITLKRFYDEHQELMEKNLAKTTLRLHLAVVGFLAEKVGWNCDMKRIKPTDIERVRAFRLRQGIASATANKELRAIKRIFNLAISRGYLNQGCSHNPHTIVHTTCEAAWFRPYQAGNRSSRSFLQGTQQAGSFHVCTGQWLIGTL